MTAWVSAMMFQSKYNEGDTDVVLARMGRVVMKQQKWIALSRNVGPGLWIGMFSPHPIAATVATRLAMEVIANLHHLLPPVSRPPIRMRGYPKGFAIELTLIGCGALLGSLLRWWW